MAKKARGGKAAAGSSDYDLRALVMLEAWQNPTFKKEVMRHPNDAVKKLGQKYGVAVPADANFSVIVEQPGDFHLILKENPLGLSPAEFKRWLRSKDAKEAEAKSGGAVCSKTAECGCPDTFTGGCACLTVFGTPCLSCKFC
jgi:hypothetical protein